MDTDASLVNGATAPLAAPALVEFVGDRQPRLVVFGNCQGHEIADLMLSLPIRADSFDVVYVAYHTLSWPDHGWQSYPDFGDRPTVLWEQMLDASFRSDALAARDKLRGLIPKGSPIIRFPPYSFSALWPFDGADPRLDLVRDADRYSAGARYYFADRLAQAVAQEPEAATLPDSVLYDMYLERFAAEVPRLDRRLNFDKARMEARDRESDISMASFIMDNFREHRLFQDSLHIGGVLLRETVQKLAEASAGILGIDAGVARTEIAGITSGHQGQISVQAPINPLVAEHFDLRYGRSNERTTYSQNQWTFRQYIVSYMRWRHYML